MNKTLNGCIKIYRELLKHGTVQVAYENLLKYMMTLKTHFANLFSGEYTFGNVSPGYMDFTYFPFFNDFLRARKLRFGVVLNHQQMRFELWLMGQNNEVQNKYWQLLKHTKWNIDRAQRPRYSVLEELLLENPDFDNLDNLTAKIEKRTMCSAKEVQHAIKTISSEKSCTITTKLLNKQ